LYRYTTGMPSDGGMMTPNTERRRGYSIDFAPEAVGLCTS
jgi:hypothetical protein